MSLFEAIVLGITQGLTEFLPISSTAHLRIVPAFAGWEDPGAAFTAVTQLGTMAAVLLYFRDDLRGSPAPGCASLRDRRGASRPRRSDRLVHHPRHDPDRDLRPGVQGPDRERRARPLPDRHRADRARVRAARRPSEVGSRSARSSTINATRRHRDRLRAGPGAGAGRVALGRHDHRGPVPRPRPRRRAARFSFLLSIPAVVLCGLFELASILERATSSTRRLGALAIATALAFVVGYASIAFLLRYLRRPLDDRLRRLPRGAGSLVLVLVSTGRDQLGLALAPVQSRLEVRRRRAGRAGARGAARRRRRAHVSSRLLTHPFLAAIALLGYRLYRQYRFDIDVARAERAAGALRVDGDRRSHLRRHRPAVELGRRGILVWFALLAVLVRPVLGLDALPPYA